MSSKKKRTLEILCERETFVTRHATTEDGRNFSCVDSHENVKCMVFKYLHLTCSFKFFF